MGTKLTDMGRSTIKDVARQAGVSVSAVSRVFTNGASASAGMRQKVNTAAESLGYRPSQIASGLVQGRTNLVTFVAGHSFGSFDAMFMEALTSAVAAAGSKLLLAQADVEDPNDSGLLQALDYQSDAVVVAAGTMRPKHSEMCLQVGLPIILVGREVDVSGVHCVLPDNRGGARQAGELFLRTGCKKIAYLGRHGETFADDERREGLMAVVGAAGLELQVAAVMGRSASDHFDDAVNLFTQGNAPDAVFCASDSIAVSVIEAARHLGLRVPEDVSIVGFNNVPIAALKSFQLTTIEYPISSTVDTIMKLIESKVSGGSPTSSVDRIPTRLILRNTSRAVAPQQGVSRENFDV